MHKAKIDPRTVSYVEAHGTGTELGDPIEISGLTQAYSQFTSDRQFCAIGSVKPNIGHLESAAGIAGLTKVLLQMKHATLVPSLHSTPLNPNINFQRTPFTVQKSLGAWKRPLLTIDGREQEFPRIAGISSFGVGGANAHVIVEEYIATPLECAEMTPAIDGRPALIVLSARSEVSLQAGAARLLHVVESSEWTVDALFDMAFTLQVGREEFDHRVAFSAWNAIDIIDKLRRYLDRTAQIEGLYTGALRRQNDVVSLLKADGGLKEVLGKAILEGNYSVVLALWVNGIHVDWQSFYGPGTYYGTARRRRISLPTYAFAREKYWIEVEATAAPLARSVAGAEALVAPADPKATQVQVPLPTSGVGEAKTVGTLTMVPLWESQLVDEEDAWPADLQNVVVIGGNERFCDCIRRRYPRLHTLTLSAAQTISEIAAYLSGCGEIDHLFWCAAEEGDGTIQDEGLIDSQSGGAVHCFLCVKALLALGYGDRTFGLTVVTYDAQPISRAHALNPAQASVHGLIGSLAKERPSWKARLVDLEASSDLPIDQLLKLPADAHGDAWAFRRGESGLGVN